MYENLLSEYKFLGKLAHFSLSFQIQNELILIKNFFLRYSLYFFCRPQVRKLVLFLYANKMVIACK